MKVICITNQPLHPYNPLPLTINKLYQVLNIEHIPFSKHRFDDDSGTFYKIICDNGETKMINSNKFRELTINEKRELKLNDLLNEKNL